MAVNLPDSNKVPGDANHTSDTNLIIEAINTLQSQVDNIPAGDTGAKGDTGEAGAAGTPATVTVGSTTTSAAGGNAAVTNSGTASDAIFDFTIPRGAVGPKGDTGAQGAQGPKGDAGDNAAISVGTVATGAPGSSASVTNSGTTANAVLDFSIPRGDKGEIGDLTSASQAILDAAVAAALASEQAADASESAAAGSASAASSSASAAAASATSAASSASSVDATATAAAELRQFGAAGSILDNVPTRVHPAESLLKQAVWWIDSAHSSADQQEVENLGWGGSALNAQLGSSSGADSNDPKYLDWDGENYVYLPGVSGNYLSVPDEAALDITGDIDIRVQVAMDDWTPAADQVLVS